MVRCNWIDQSERMDGIRVDETVLWIGTLETFLPLCGGFPLSLWSYFFCCFLYCFSFFLDAPPLPTSSSCLSLLSRSSFSQLSLIPVSLFLITAFLRYNECNKIQPFKVYTSAVLVYSESCKQHHCLISEHFFTPQNGPVPISSHSLFPIPPGSGQPLFYFLSLWTFLL